MGDYRKKLMSKNGRTIVALAKEMLSKKIGDRILTVGAYADQFETGRGTVQTAIGFLKDEKAISLESRGHLGTFITSIDYKKLWGIADIGTIMAVMPLPYSKRYEGLATGLYKTFDEANIPFSLAFMRGATKRIEALNMGKYNFVIVSKLAAKLEIRKNNDIEIAYEFGENSYVGNHVLILKDKDKSEIEDGMRVALDPASTDQMILTNYECSQKEVEYVEVSYSQILDKLANDEIDAAIWNGDEIDEHKLGLNIRALTNSKTQEASKDDTIAVILTNKKYNEFKDFIKQFLDMQNIEDLQQQVMSKEIIPMY
ncbi:GntR family transcriptional regulator YhfZ [Proteinivorax hydrogeniformans]|uniref:GntR family transcriptional regulator YhfZ n=1 Tax=Proteinivorax hydrogeniformans TaxID=1826727 RepID=A0AAU8HR59_9FIRM